MGKIEDKIQSRQTHNNHRKETNINLEPDNRIIFKVATSRQKQLFMYINDLPTRLRRSGKKMQRKTNLTFKKKIK